MGFQGAGYVAPRRKELNVAKLPSEELYEDQMGDRLPDIIRIAAGLAANPAATGNMAPAQIAAEALAIVLACEEACDLGGGA